MAKIKGLRYSIKLGRKTKVFFFKTELFVRTWYKRFFDGLEFDSNYMNLLSLS